MRVTLVLVTDHDPSGLDTNRFYIVIPRFKGNLDKPKIALSVAAKLVPMRDECPYFL